jgi:hypothetical protein
MKTKKQIVAFNKGKPCGVFESMRKASKALGVSPATISLKLRTGEETLMGFSFDYWLWD